VIVRDAGVVISTYPGDQRITIYSGDDDQILAFSRHATYVVHR